MTTDHALHLQWLDLRDRLRAKHLMSAQTSSLSMRMPDGQSMWFGQVTDEAPRQIKLQGPAHGAELSLHTAAYLARPDVGAIAMGGGEFGRCLEHFDGVMPQAFDEQARHLGPMGPPVSNVYGLARSLRQGGNVVLAMGLPMCLGMTATRLALNAELFEKCAKAHVMAVASGGRVRPLPWIVRFVANRRLSKDEQRATLRFANGLLPEETKGY